MTYTNQEPVGLAPFLKWPGGKRWLWQRHSKFFAVDYERYVEPFLGGAAVFFAIHPQKAVLADLNQHLVNTYRTLEADWRAVWTKLQEHHRRHSQLPDYYYAARASKPRSEAGLAAKFIYLNRTCFNGIYRVNLKGEFNVPKGTKNSVIFPDDNFHEISFRLKNAKLLVADFEEIIDSAGRGDFLFIDPPYTVKHNNNGFIKYNERIFSWQDQERLAKALRRLRRRGGKALVTNAAHQSVVDLYGELGEVHVLDRCSTLSSDVSKRMTVEEIAVTVGYSVKSEVTDVKRHMKKFQDIGSTKHPGYP
jgi:DNA adenine methylase